MTLDYLAAVSYVWEDDGISYKTILSKENKIYGEKQLMLVFLFNFVWLCTHVETYLVILYVNFMFPFTSIPMSLSFGFP